MSYSVVWFKRDLRLHDHAALVEAASLGPILCLYGGDPELWAQADAARQHFEFILESLRDLYRALRGKTTPKKSKRQNPDAPTVDKPAPQLSFDF